MEEQKVELWYNFVHVRGLRIYQELMGKVISELGNKTPLLGVVPEQKITYIGTFYHM